MSLHSLSLHKKILCCITVAIILLGARRSEAVTGFSIPVGLVFEHNFYNQFGIYASLAHSRIVKEHPRVALSVTSSRLPSLAGKNVLKKENYLFNAGWYFRPGKLIDPFAGIDFGFTRFSLEDEDLFAKLDNKAALLNVRVGISSTFWKERICLSLDGGYCIISSSTVYPLFFGCTVGFDIAKGVLS